MEFKVFKNENDKILKEYWLTQSEWDALDKTTVQEGDIYHIVGTIDKGDLSADVNASLAKGDSSLQKPTATLAKESFVKVGIDGTQKFDETNYAALDAGKSNDFLSTNTFYDEVKFKGDSGHQAIFYPETAKIAKSYSLIDDVDNPTSEMTVNYCNPNTEYPSAQLQYIYPSMAEYNGRIGVEFVQTGEKSAHASLGITQWNSGEGYDPLVPAYQSMFMDLGRGGTASIIVNDYDKNDPNGNPLTSSRYKFRKNNTTNTVATIEDVISATVKDPSKTYLVWKGNQFPNSTDATFKAPAGCVIDWGDGNVETFGTASTVVNTHTYTDGIEYHLISLSNYTVIDNSAFSNCSGLTSVTIGNNVASIDWGAFSDCEELTSVTIGSGLTSISDLEFYGCSGLTSITIPDSVTSINDRAFAYCNRLKTVEMLAINPPTLGAAPFENSPIEKIIVPKSAINAYKSAAGWSTYTDKIVYEVDSSDLVSLKTKLNENIIKDPSKTYLVWKGNQFPNSTNATFKAPAGCVIDWGDGNVETFETASTTVNTHTYSDGIEYHLISLSNYASIGNAAFENCSGLTSITIPNSVTSIGNSAFYRCSGLTSIIIGNGVTSIGNAAFSSCSGLTSITIPNSVTSIGGYAFYNCSGLTSITIPNSVTSIGDHAFSDCRGLTSVIIGNGVTSIGDHAFNGCSRLKTIRISAINSPTLYSNTFSNTSIEKIIVPKSAINAYKTAAGWSTYADKIVYEVDSGDVVNQPFITGQYILNRGQSLSISYDKMYFIQCFDKNNNLVEFSINSELKNLKGKFAFIVAGDTKSNGARNLAIVQTGSLLISELVKTTAQVNTVSPLNNDDRIAFYEVDGALEAFKGDPGVSVTAINLVKNSSGDITSGTATLSNGTSVPITVTTA